MASLRWKLTSCAGGPHFLTNASRALASIGLRFLRRGQVAERTGGGGERVVDERVAEERCVAEERTRAAGERRPGQTWAVGSRGHRVQGLMFMCVVVW